MRRRGPISVLIEGGVDVASTPPFHPANNVEKDGVRAVEMCERMLPLLLELQQP
jgi:hypothetical protein